MIYSFQEEYVIERTVQVMPGDNVEMDVDLFSDVAVDVGSR